MLRNFYNRVRAKLIKRYRVEFIDDVTLSQSRQYSIKPIKVVWLGILLLLGIVGGTVVMFIYTPSLHQLIPGYRPPEEVEREKIEILAMIKALEEKQSNTDAYESSIKKIAGFEGGAGPALDKDRLDSMRAEASQDYTENENISEDEGNTENTQVENVQPSVRNTGIVAVSQGGNPSKREDRSGILDLFPPVKGQIENPFDEARLHYGVDIVAEENTLIKSAADGYVVISEYSDANGWIIGVSSRDNVVTFYKHNSRLLKKAGTYVYSGEPIAVIGNSGENSTGMHLHFELWHNGVQLDPANYIEFN